MTRSTLTFPLTFAPLTRGDAYAIAQWCYPAPYDIYTWDPEGALADSNSSNFAVRDETGMLIGHWVFGDDGRVPGGGYLADALDTGGGLRPDLTGSGHGSKILLAALAFGTENYSPHAFRVTIAAFNLRARRMCEKVGFTEVERFQGSADGREYVILHRVPTSNDRAICG